MTQLIAVGFWVDDRHPDWPDPHELIAPDLSQDESREVASYLDRGIVVQLWRGWSHCRICDDKNGHADLTDGTYLWPEGLAHYVREHHVRLPSRFTAHVTARLHELRNAEIDELWWSEQRGKRTWH
jgi:hypothetical protein